MRSLERIEAEGERLLKSVAEFAERYVPEPHRKAVEELAKDAVKYVGQLNASMEENAKKLVEKLNVPTRKELDEYNKKIHLLIEENVRTRIEKLRVPSGKELDQMGKQMRKNVEEQTLKVLGRLNIATKKDVDSVALEVKKLRKDVSAIRNPVAASKGTASRKKTSK